MGIVCFCNKGPTPKGPTITDPEISARAFSNVSLTCLIDWDPDDHTCPENWSWYLSADLPITGEKYNESLEDTGSKCKKEFVLSIFNVTENDEGTYSCHVFCEDKNTTKAAIDLKVVVQLPTGIVRKAFWSNVNQMSLTSLAAKIPF